MPKKDDRNYGSLFVPAGVLGGMGVGWAIDNFLAGMFIGLGVGFLLYGLVAVLKK